MPFWQKRYPFNTPFIEKRRPFHISTLEHCPPFLRPCNEVNEQYYGRISRITRRNVKQTTSVIYSVHVVKQPIFPPFYIPELVKSLPFHLPEAWKRCPFRADTPRTGHYREYSPPPGIITRVHWIVLLTLKPRPAVPEEFENATITESFGFVFE